jgi:hypothetical protein
MKDNKLIAEFMWKHSIALDVTDAKYHESWDWLMPVIQKVNEVSGYDDYNTDRLHIQRVLDDCINENAVGIDSVHKAVVEFIKKYNNED